MKKLIVLGSLALCMAGCTQNEGKTDATPESKMAGTSDTAKMEYAYTVESNGDWVAGSRENAANVLKAFKAYENNNIAECAAYFADSVELRFDRFRAKLSKDSLTKWLTQDRNSMKAFSVKMEDWESVKSKDGTKEYVSMWYKQTVTDSKGKTDSMNCMDDIMIKNGKIAYIDQKVQHFPESKKM